MPIIPVLAYVLALRHQFEVVNRIVQAVAGDVMDNLAAVKRAAKMLRHNNAMLVGQLAVIPNHSVATAFIDVPANVFHGHIIRDAAAT